jgi:hypothetical protein
MAEICIASDVGVAVNYSDWRFLFSEDPHRFLAAVPPERHASLTDICGEVGVPLARIGTAGGDAIVFDRGGVRAAVDLELARETWRRALPEHLRN